MVATDAREARCCLQLMRDDVVCSVACSLLYVVCMVLGGLIIARVSRRTVNANTVDRRETHRSAFFLARCLAPASDLSWCYQSELARCRVPRRVGRSGRPVVASVKYDVRAYLGRKATHWINGTVAAS